MTFVMVMISKNCLSARQNIWKTYCCSYCSDCRTVVTIMPWRKRFVTQVNEEGGENDDDGDDGDDHSDHNGGDDEESGDDNALKEKVWVSKFYEEKFCSVDGRGGRCSYTRISLREDAGWLRWDEFSFFAMKVPLAQRLRWVFYLA